jgi:hypothetical protein
MSPSSVAALEFSALFVVIGVALLRRTATAGGGVVRYVLGALFGTRAVARVTLEHQGRR